MLTPEQIAEGWIEHDGRPCPVDGESRPAMMFEHPMGEVCIHEPSERTPMQRAWRARMADWSQCIAYRPEPRP